MLLRATLVVAGLYGGLVVAARLSYRRFLYPAPPPLGDAVPDGAVLLTLRASDGVPVHALQFGASLRRTIVFFHGNGELMEYNAVLAELLRARGFNVVLAEYRGYGRSRAAEPSEEGLYRDATAVLDALETEGIGRERIVLWGFSLGSGVAAEMARRGRGSALVLVAPYTSIPAVGARFAPFLPMGFVVPDVFATLAKAREIRIPTLVIHGDHDQVVPYDMGQTVAAAIAGARLVTVPGGHHTDLFVTDGARLLQEVSEVVGR